MNRENLKEIIIWYYTKKRHFSIKKVNEIVDELDNKSNNDCEIIFKEIIENLCVDDFLELYYESSLNDKSLIIYGIKYLEKSPSFFHDDVKLEKWFLSLPDKYKNDEDFIKNFVKQINALSDLEQETMKIILNFPSLIKFYFIEEDNKINLFHDKVFYNILRKKMEANKIYSERIKKILYEILISNSSNATDLSNALTDKHALLSKKDAEYFFPKKINNKELAIKLIRENINWYYLIDDILKKDNEIIQILLSSRISEELLYHICDNKLLYAQNQLEKIFLNFLSKNEYYYDKKRFDEFWKKNSPFILKYIYSLEISSILEMFENNRSLMDRMFLTCLKDKSRKLNIEDKLPIYERIFKSLYSKEYYNCNFIFFFNDSDDVLIIQKLLKEHPEYVLVLPWDKLPNELYSLLRNSIVNLSTDIKNNDITNYQNFFHKFNVWFNPYTKGIKESIMLDERYVEKFTWEDIKKMIILIMMDIIINYDYQKFPGFDVSYNWDFASFWAHEIDIMYEEKDLSILQLYYDNNFTIEGVPLYLVIEYYTNNKMFSSKFFARKNPSFKEIKLTTDDYKKLDEFKTEFKIHHAEFLIILQRIQEVIKTFDYDISPFNIKNYLINFNYHIKHCENEQERNGLLQMQEITNSFDSNYYHQLKRIETSEDKNKNHIIKPKI